MEHLTTDILAALAVVVNGIPQGLLALGFGFAAFPTALAFVVGIAGSLLFHSVATISFQAETITLAGKMGRNVRERLSIVFWGALFLFIPSALGLNEKIVAFIGPTIVTSMMAGVGIMLAMVSIDMLNSEKYSGFVSMVTGLAVWFLTLDLAKTIIISVLVSTVVYNVLKKTGRIQAEHMEIDESREKLTLGNIEWKLWEHPNIIVNGLALSCLNIGANISFGKITGGIAGVDANIDHLAIYSSLADMTSSFFGGGPVEAIISGTATAPNALRSSVIMMALMALILLLKLLPTIGKYLHSASIAGFLFVLGTFVTFTTNMQGTIASVPEIQGGFGFTPWGMVVGVTVLATARWNPFFGLLAGVAVKMIFSL
ncbi:NCS2 family permease [Synergistaceae bacterium OttesenSCG-928-D05]|nr:NCS2 family permease [Synergistaceae bacterium OttesenSCG-928-D05]